MNFNGGAACSRPVIQEGRTRLWDSYGRTLATGAEIHRLLKNSFSPGSYAKAVKGARYYLQLRLHLTTPTGEPWAIFPAGTCWYAGAPDTVECIKVDSDVG